jgi:hypothetical protein
MGRLTAQTVFCWLAAAAVLFGCTYPQQQSISTPELPEEIYMSPPDRYSEKPLVCVLGFTSPDFAPDMGRFAALLLNRELLKRGIPSKIRLDVTRPPCRSEADDGGLSGSCDQIITGDLLYYFEGGELLPSRVDQQIRVVDVHQPFARILWEARATEISEPIYSRDWIILRGSGAAALPAAELMRRNAEKFANMISMAEG